MRKNFSNRVQIVIQYSREEALRLGHDYIGTEHLLLGLIREGEGIAIEILNNLGCDLDELKNSIEDAVKTTGDTMTVGDIPLTKRAEKILKMAENRECLSDFSIASRKILNDKFSFPSQNEKLIDLYMHLSESNLPT